MARMRNRELENQNQKILLECTAMNMKNDGNTNMNDENNEKTTKTTIERLNEEQDENNHNPRLAGYSWQKMTPLK